jgi:FAD synthase
MKTKKKIRISKRKDGSKFIELNPTLNEAKTSTAVVTFGRFNPPTIGHQKLVDKVVAVAKAKRAIPLVYASHSSDKKKNPLSYDSKIKY